MAKTKTDAAVPVDRQWTPRVDTRFLRRLADEAACAAGRPGLEVEAPFTGDVLGTVPLGAPEDVGTAIERARVAQQAWAATDVHARAAVLLGFHDLVIANAHEGLDLVQLELGKSRKHAYEELLDVAITARYDAHVAAGCLKPRLRQGALPLLTMATEYRRPKGVVGVISPWNYPLTLAVTDALAALVAGNAVVVKPDSQTPYTALWAARLLREAGLPDGVLQVVTGRGAELGPELIAGSDYLMFTGSTATGRLLAQQAAERLIDCSMELGGKNPAIVLDDAPFGLGVAGTTLGLSCVHGLVSGITACTGQLCISTERLYVQDGIYDRFVPALAEALGEVRLGPALDLSVDVGSLASAEQFAKVSGHVEDAVAKGARVLAGGRPRPDLGPYFYEPTLLEGVTDEMELCRAETFGPVCSVYRFGDVDEALPLVNDTTYGLNASVWSRDVRRAKAIAARIEAGTVGINDPYQATWASMSPMGGFKESGVGRRHGRGGILRFTEAQAIAVERLNPIDRIPFLDNDRYVQVMTPLIKLMKYLHPVIK